MHTRRHLLALAALPFTAGKLRAQAFPARPIRIVAGMAPGTVVDLTARILASRLEQRLGQSIVVENRVGANGSIAANAVARSAPDGYTLWYGTPTTVHPIYLKNNAVVLGKDLVPVTNVFSTPYVLHTSARLPATSFQDLVTYAKSQPPGKLNFALITPTFDLLMHLLKERSGLTYTTIPYLGGIPASITAMRAGDVDFAFGGLAAYPPHVQAGAFARCSSRRAGVRRCSPTCPRRQKPASPISRLPPRRASWHRSELRRTWCAS